MKICTGSFINCNNELILVPKLNIYFRLEDVLSVEDLYCKVIAYLSRSSYKDANKYWQKYCLGRFNQILGTSFSYEQMEIIYTHLGNDCNRDKTREFINSGYNLAVLQK